MSELQVALSNYRRSFNALGMAFVHASCWREPEDYGVDPLEAADVGANELMAAFAEREPEIDLLPTYSSLRALLGLISAKTGKTPRTILEEEFAVAPGDDYWRAATRARKENDGDR